MAKLDDKHVKEYFRREGTVSKWWYPEEHRNVKDRKLYLTEIRDVIKLTEPKGKVILDCGTGKGRTAIRLVKEGAKLVIGIDVSKEKLDIWVLPNSKRAQISQQETSPIKLFEYMAAERPIVASNLPSLREILRDQENAVLFEPDKPSSLARAIKNLASNS